MIRVYRSFSVLSSLAFESSHSFLSPLFSHYAAIKIMINSHIFNKFIKIIFTPLIFIPYLQYTHFFPSPPLGIPLHTTLTQLPSILFLIPLSIIQNPPFMTS